MESVNETLGSQLLSFTLRNENFAVDIFKVREVLDVGVMTRIPRMPDYFCGVINLRGNVVPVVDLGLKLGMTPVEKTINTCIMIVDIIVERGKESVMMGVLTDSVQAVLDMAPENIEPVPKMGTNLNTDFIKGMGRQGEEFLIILDLDCILATEGESILRDQRENDQMGPEKDA